MRSLPHRVIAVAAVTAAGVSAAPSQAVAGDRSDLRYAAKREYSKVKHLLGPRAPGRNIVRFGVRTEHGERPATARELRRFLSVLRRMTAHAPAPAPAPAPGAGEAMSSAPAGAGGMPACTWRPESGGSYTAVNPSSGAYGKYQIIPSTWAAHCSGIDRSPSGQEQCARNVMAAQGSGAWVNC